MIQNGDGIYLSGVGSSPQGDRPFLDRFNLKTLKSERVWMSDEDAYESVVAVLDDGATRVMTRRETKAIPGNYLVRDLGAKLGVGWSLSGRDAQVEPGDGGVHGAAIRERVVRRRGQPDYLAQPEALRAIEICLEHREAE